MGDKNRFIRKQWGKDLNRKTTLPYEQGRLNIDWMQAAFMKKEAYQ